MKGIAPVIPTHTKSSKIKKLPIFNDDRDLQKFLETNFTESLKQMIRVVVSTMVKSEMEAFREEFHEKLSFNGAYSRQMTSSFGRVADIPIPRFRQSVEGYAPGSLAVFDGEKEKFEKLIADMHILGISQRKITALAKTSFGMTISPKRVGAIHKELAEKEEFQINRQILDDNFDYILLDGIWEKTKGYGWDDNRSVLICVLGVRPDSSRKILGFTLTREEDTTGCLALLNDIKSRGLAGKNLQLAISDDTAAIHGAVRSVYPDVPIQLCIVHKMRGVFRKVGKKNQAAVIADVQTIFKSETTEEAEATAKAVVKKWFVAEEKAMAALRFNLEYCFTYLQFEKHLWSALRTTNVIEREFKEVRRRMKVFDNTFQSQESGERYANTILTTLNNTYPMKNHTH